MLEPLVTWITYRLLNFLINLIWAFSLALWYIQKAIAWLGDQIVTSSIWDTIIEGVITGMATSMPATLQTIMFGAGGGLFYLALIVVGLVLIIPFITRAQPTLELERVFGWTLVVVVLFISSTSGYDIIGVIEQNRMGMMANISSSYGSNQVSQLVAGPMSATPAEINVNEFELPAAYESIYFPDPAGFETVDVVFYDAPILGRSASTLTVETDTSIDNRLSQATLGVVLVILNLIPVGMVVILIASFVGLTGTSLVLILFFIMSLPLGMFEQGMLVINQVIKRYMLVWILSIFMSVFPGTLLGIAELTLAPPVTLESLFLYMSVLLVAVYATYHVARWIFNIATESFSVIGQSLNAVAFGSTIAGASNGGNGMPLLGQGGAAPVPHMLPPKAALWTMGAAAAATGVIQTAALGARRIAQVPFVVGATPRRGAPSFGQIPIGNPLIPATAGPREEIIEGEWQEEKQIEGSPAMLLGDGTHDYAVQDGSQMRGENWTAFSDESDESDEVKNDNA